LRGQRACRRRGVRPGMHVRHPHCIRARHVRESFVKLGIIPGDGGAWFLPRTVGMSKAAEMTFTGDPVTAQEARSSGLVSKVVPAEQLMDEARALARRIAANPGTAVRMAKRLLRAGQSVSLDTLLEMSAAFQAIAHHTPEHEEAVARSSIRPRSARLTGLGLAETGMDLGLTTRWLSSPELAGYRQGDSCAARQRGRCRRDCRAQRDLLDSVAGRYGQQAAGPPGSGRCEPAEDCTRLVAEAVSAFGRLDILVNNAGTSGNG